MIEDAIRFSLVKCRNKEKEELRRARSPICNLAFVAFALCGHRAALPPHAGDCDPGNLRSTVFWNCLGGRVCNGRKEDGAHIVYSAAGIVDYGQERIYARHEKR